MNGLLAGHALTRAPPQSDDGTLDPSSSTQFPPKLEKDYLDDLKPMALWGMRTWLTVSLVLGLAMIWNVARGNALAARIPLLLELGFHLPLALGTGWWLARLGSVRLREGAFIAAALARLVCMGIESDLTPQNYLSRYLILAALTLFSAIVLVPLRTVAVRLYALIGMAVVAANAVCFGHLAASGDQDVLVFVGLLALLGLRARLNLDGERRRNYLLRMQERRRGAELAHSNARLLELSDTDPLTGIGNRRSFEHTLDRLVRVNTARDLALLMLDVDYFKQFNDSYGHPRGDECLKLVARTLHEQVRNMHDHVARYGGEEFAVVLPDADGAAALEIAERMRMAVETLRLPHLGRPNLPLQVTVSVGVASVIVSGETVRQSLIKNADAALYSAKTAGRNNSFCHQAPA